MKFNSLGEGKWQGQLCPLPEMGLPGTHDPPAQVEA